MIAEFRSLPLIRDLVGFDTTSREPNQALIGYVRDYLRGYGITSELIWNDYHTKANLWATIGSSDVPGVILSGHTDVVPVNGQDWSSNPFILREAEGLLYGRGTADMKGFLAIALAMVPQMLAERLACPFHLAFSYDEEVGCSGVKSLIERLRTLPVKPALCVVGEPTHMRPVIGHKGGRTYKVHVRCTEAHSSLAPFAVNAIEYAAELIVILRGIAEEMRAGPRDEQYDIAHSTLQTGVVHGGTAINIVPRDCEFIFEFRHLLDTDPEEIKTKKPASKLSSCLACAP
jgi:acetylornithine deacetylase